MKKYCFILMIMALGFTSCFRESQETRDVVSLSKGQLSFYDAETHALTPFKAESDSVVNMVFADRDHLYYSAANNQKLSLKMIDLSESKPTPKLCANWNLTVEETIDYMFGRASELFVDEQGKNIYILGMDFDEGFMVPYAYNLDSRQVRKVGDEERIYNAGDWIDYSRFFTYNHLFYYVSPKGKACLNDKIDFSMYITDEMELQDLEFGARSFSPDGKKVLYTAMVYWGEGWGYYCVADADGASQRVLGDSDAWHGDPKWLADGTLVYIGQTERPESDPDYEEDYNTTQPCLKVIDPMGIEKYVGLAEKFVVRPTAAKRSERVIQGDLEGCDVAVFDNGKVNFYNSSTGQFVPFVAEKDSVINGVFADEYTFYYTVKIGNQLYLKTMYLGTYDPAPLMLTDWGLTYDDCVSETYGKASSLVWIPMFERVGINHTFSWDFYNFSEIRFYDGNSGELIDGWSEEDEVETDIFDDSFMQYESDLELFAAIENNYYYFTEEQPVCVSDKIDFAALCSDPEYCGDPEFEFYSVDPTRHFVAYVAFIEWGDLGHGPLCIASLDGTRQTAIEGTDAADLTWGWLSDGSLLYVGSEPRPADDPAYDPEWNTEKPCVRIIRPDGTNEIFSHSADFVVLE